MSSANLPPFVRHMLLCEEVSRDPENPNRVNLYGLTSTIRSTSNPPFPLLHPVLCVYLVLTGVRGVGEGQVVVVAADTDQPVFASQRHQLAFTLANPLDGHAAVFRIHDCVFPREGLYWVEFR